MLLNFTQNIFQSYINNSYNNLVTKVAKTDRTEGFKSICLSILRHQHNKNMIASKIQLSTLSTLKTFIALTYPIIEQVDEFHPSFQRLPPNL